MSSAKRKLKRAILGAQKAWDMLYKAKIKLIDAWEACNESEQRSVCEDEGLTVPSSDGGGDELFNDLFA